MTLPKPPVPPHASRAKAIENFLSRLAEQNLNGLDGDDPIFSAVLGARRILAMPSAPQPPASREDAATTVAVAENEIARILRDLRTRDGIEISRVDIACGSLCDFETVIVADNLTSFPQGGRGDGR